MTITLADIWRHPIKAHGREALERVELIAGKTLPWDRVWAVAHEVSKATAGEWSPCANFSRGAKAPQLMAIQARLDEASGTVLLRHPDLPDLEFNPDKDPDALIAWSAPLMPENRAASARIIRGDQGMTDSPFPSISLCNLSSHRAVEGRAGRKLSPNRWRGNLWLEGLAPWEEFDFIGREIEIGAARLAIKEPITRCTATMANTRTGQRDTDTLAILREGWDHQEFGVYGEVIASGEIAVGDTARLV